MSNIWNEDFTGGTEGSFNGDILPSITNTYNLGSASYQWSNIYSNTINNAGSIFTNSLTSNTFISSPSSVQTSTADATDASGTTGALQCHGGASIAKSLWVGTLIHTNQIKAIGSTISIDATGVAIGTGLLSTIVQVGNGTSSTGIYGNTVLVQSATGQDISLLSGSTFINCNAGTLKNVSIVSGNGSLTLTSTTGDVYLSAASGNLNCEGDYLTFVQGIKGNTANDKNLYISTSSGGLIELNGGSGIIMNSLTTFSQANIYNTSGSITASTTITQAAATPLTNEYNIIGGPGSATAVKLPATANYSTVTVINWTGAVTSVFPNTGDAINSLGVNNPITVAIGSSIKFIAININQWLTIQPPSSSSATLVATSTTDATDYSGATGALQVPGGGSIAKSMWVGTSTHTPLLTHDTGDLALTTTTSGNITLTSVGTVALSGTSVNMNTTPLINLPNLQILGSTIISADKGGLGVGATYKNVTLTSFVNGHNDLGTVPAGKRWQFAARGFAYNTSGLGITYTVQVKISGTYYNISGPITIPNNSSTNIGTQTIIFEPGDIISLNVTSGSGAMIWIDYYIEYPNTFPSVYSPRLVGLSTGDNTLYTVPTGKTAILSNYPLSTLIGQVIFMGDVLARSVSVKYNGTVYNQNTSTNVNSTTPINFAPAMQSGDVCKVNVDTGSANQLAWITVTEL